MTKPTMTKPIIALSAGDPAGIGPELIVALADQPDLAELLDLIVVGDPDLLAKAARALNRRLDIAVIDRPDQADPDSGRLTVIPCAQTAPADHCFGRTSAGCGACAHAAIVQAVELAMTGQADAVCTAPISKASLQAAGVKYPGHTELLADLTKADGPPVMCLAGPVLKVSLATTHLSMNDLPAAITTAKLVRVFELSADFLVRLGIDRPRIAVCGLNPHAGEEGLFGDEEQTVIAPAVEQGRAKGLDLTDPLPADTLFHRAAQGQFDLVAAMYHDQGLGPLKLLHFDNAVNVTLGLPIIRTSPDHGTAFDIAGQGLASPRSLIAALKTAAALAAPERKISPWD